MSIKIWVGNSSFAGGHKQISPLSFQPVGLIPYGLRLTFFLLFSRFSSGNRCACFWLGRFGHRLLLKGLQKKNTANNVVLSRL